MIEFFAYKSFTFIPNSDANMCKHIPCDYVLISNTEKSITITSTASIQRFRQTNFL